MALVALFGSAALAALCAAHDGRGAGAWGFASSDCGDHFRWALDALRYCRDWLEPLGELAAVLHPKWREASSYGVGQLRLYEVRRFRSTNPLIERNPRLARMSDARLAWNLAGNIYLTAFKLKSMFDAIASMTDEEIDGIKERTGIDLTEIRRKANSGQELELSEVSALYAAYNEEPERGMETGSYWDWLKARDIRAPIAERVAYQYAELWARAKNAALSVRFESSPGPPGPDRTA
jgi:hypothetical protein